MKTAFAIAWVGAALLLTGCSQTKTVGILALKWEVGQHQDCVYKTANLYCIPANSENIVGLPLHGWKDKTGKPIEMTRSQLLFAQAVALTHRADQNRAEAARDRDAETGTYDAKFSASPVDYSIWDCMKTGVASPGISCALTRKRTDKDDQAIADKEREEQLNDSLKTLTMDGLQTRCGNPGSTASDSISRSLIYTSASGVPIAFRFDTFGEHNPILLESAESQEQRTDPKVARKIFWWKSSSSAHAAGLLVKDMPCLKQ